jgi:putative spermidine/putrescine transport system substrate-binding protein
VKKNAIDRRDFLKYAAAMGGGVLMGGGIPLPRMASAKPKFTLASSGGSWGAGNRKVFVEQSGFQKKFDLDVEYHHQIDSVVVAQAMSNKNNPIFDAVSALLPNAVKMYIAGAAVEGLDMNIVTNWPDIYPQAKFKNVLGGFCFLNYGLVYNTKHVKRPQSFKDLWNPKYKGRVGIPDYAWMGNSYLHGINKLFGGAEENTMPGIEALADLMKKQKPILVQNTDHAMKLFTSEELVIMSFWDGRTRMLQGQGVPVDFVWAENFIAMFIGMCLMKNSKDPKLSMEFVNTSLGPDVQVEFMKIFKYAPCNRKCKFPAGFEHVKVTEKELEKAADLDWLKVVKDLEKNLELWNKHVLGA